MFCIIELIPFQYVAELLISASICLVCSSLNDVGGLASVPHVKIA